jgi:hypothetical protein
MWKSILQQLHAYSHKQCDHDKLRFWVHLTLKNLKGLTRQQMTVEMMWYTFKGPQIQPHKIDS